MTTQRIAIVLTVINLVILLVLVTYRRPLTEDVAPVLRGRSLEIVDEQGRTRAQIIVTSPTTMPDGEFYSESSLFRLIDPNGRPVVKIGGSVDGSGMSLGGDSEKRDWSGIQILAKGEGSTVKLTNKDGREQVIKP